MHSQENCDVSVVPAEKVKRKRKTKRGSRAGRRVQAKRLKLLLKQPCSLPMETEQNAQTVNNTLPPSASSTEKSRAENSTDTPINETPIVENPLVFTVKVICELRGINNEYL